MKEKAFKILSIDGGGIKGLYSANLLAAMEKKTGKPIGTCFDMICGTSTGGLIALALANGQPAQDLVDLYYKHGSDIFPTSNNKWLRKLQSVWQGFKQATWGGKYSNKSLEANLKKVFGEKTLGELNNLVCIPSFNLTQGTTRVFKYPHPEGGFFKDKDVPLVDAALATSAAPTYLPIHRYENELYVDGGVWANNPSLCGVLEALDYFVGEDKAYDRIDLLSIPSVEASNAWTPDAAKNKSFARWRDKLFQTSMDGQAFFTDFFLKKTIEKLAPNSRYHRIQSPALSKAQMDMISMDRTDTAALDTIQSLGDFQGANIALDADVLHFFETPKTYSTK